MRGESYQFLSYGNICKWIAVFHYSNIYIYITPPNFTFTFLCYIFSILLYTACEMNMLHSRSTMAPHCLALDWGISIFIKIPLVQTVFGQNVNAALSQLGNLPVERAKDAVCFLQQCGVSLMSSYAVCFLQRGGVSLASSAIIYNIVKVKVTHWPVNPFTPCAFCSGVAWAWRRLLSYII